MVRRCPCGMEVISVQSSVANLCYYGMYNGTFEVWTSKAAFDAISEPTTNTLYCLFDYQSPECTATPAVTLRPERPLQVRRPADS